MIGLPHTTGCAIHALSCLHDSTGWCRALARRAEEISLLKVVAALNGRRWISDCLLNLPDCSGGELCPTRRFWQHTRAEITMSFATTTLASLLACRPTMPAPHKRVRRSTALPLSS